MTERRFEDSSPVDFVVVGSGAAGAVIARELANGGFSTIVLEQGPRLTPADFEHDELKYWFLSGITNDPARSPQTFRTDTAATAVPTGMRPALAGAQRVIRAAIREQSFSMHLLGTCRMGDDPRTSVVDRYHRTHDIRNLFLCDGSSLVTSGRGQPTMTIQALAFRAADHMARFARAGDI
jgi:choline dehydrogenase-like flavoprotein